MEAGPATQTPPSMEPISAGERIPALDVLRGFALFGVLLAYTLWNLGSPPPETYSPGERILDFALSSLIDTKCYTLFAFLFGLGFAIQLSRADARGTDIAPVYRRRLLALLGIGLAHALLLRNGDILVPYAVMGFFLLLFRYTPDRRLLFWGIFGLLFPYLARAAWRLTGFPIPERPSTSGMGYFAENAAWVRYWYSTAVTQWPGSLPMFLFGLYAGRHRIFEEAAANLRVFRRALAGGFVLGVLASLARILLMNEWKDSPTFAQSLTLGLLWSAHAWGLAAFYASSITLLVQRLEWQRLLAPVGAVGRMALTNYILQAAIIVPVCLLFNLFDRVTPTLGLLLGLGVWAFQVPFSVWWLKRYRFGPVEWVWRSLTYGRAQPMRAADDAAA